MDKFKLPLYWETELFIRLPDKTERTITTYDDLKEFLQRYRTIEDILLDAALNCKLMQIEIKQEGRLHYYEG